MERAAEECDVAADRLAAGEARDRLIDDGLEDRGGEIGLGRALVDEGLNIGFCEHAASGGDGINFLIILCGLVETLGIGLEKSCHLVDKRAGAACANAIHTLLKTAAEVDDLGILAAELDGYVGFGGDGFKGGGYCHDLLDEWNIKSAAEVDRARARDTGRDHALAYGLLSLAKKLGKSALSISAVTAIAAKYYFILRVEQNQLDGG